MSKTIFPGEVQIKGPGPWVDVKARGALGDGVTDDTTALAAAATAAINAGAPLYFPPGTYVYTGSGLFASASRIEVIGAGRSAVTIALGSGSYFLAPTGSLTQTHVADLTVSGGAGAFKHSVTGANVLKHHTFERCVFTGYTVCAIANNSSDMPYWRVRDCQFNAATSDTTIGIALSGGVDNSVIESCSFMRNRVDIKLRNAGITAHIRDCDFIHFDGAPANPRARVWCVPLTSATNAGRGLTIKDNKFGNENLVAGDYEILYADEDAASGSDNGTKQPKLNADSTGFVIGHEITGNKFSAASAAGDRPVIYSTTPNVRAINVHDNVLDGTPSYILQFRTPPSVDRTVTTSLFGPFSSADIGVEGVGIPITNAVWLGSVTDPLGQFDTATGKGFAALPGGGNPVGYTELLTTGIRSFNNPNALTRANVADALGGSNASEITFTSGSITYGQVATTPTVGEPSYLEFDLKAGSSSPLGRVTVTVLYTGPGAIHAKRIVAPPASGWTSYRFPLVFATTASNIIVQFTCASGDSGKLQIGRVRLYHASEPQVAPDAGLAYNVRAYGATGDGTTDDTAAIQAAITAVGAGGTVFFPPGTYKVTNELLVTQQSTITAIFRGSGRDTTVLLWTADLGANKYAIRGSGAVGGAAYVLRDLTLSGPTPSNTPGAAVAAMYGVRLESRTAIERCFIKGFKAGCVVVGEHQTITDTRIRNNYYGCYWITSSAVGDQYFDNVDLTDNSHSSIAIAAGVAMDSVTFVKGHLGYGPYAVYIESHSSDWIAMSNVLFLGTRFESQGNGVFYDASTHAECRDVQLDNCTLGNRATDKTLTSTPFPAPIAIRLMNGWSIVGGTFPTASASFVGDNAVFAECSTIQNLVWTQAGLSSLLATAVTAGKPFARAKVATGNVITQGTTRAVLCKPTSSEGVTIRQVVGHWNGHHPRPYATVYGVNPLSQLAGIALTTAPADNGTVQDLLLYATEGIGVSVDTTGTIAANAQVMPDPADRNKITAYVGDGPHLGMLSAGQTPSGATTTSIDLHPGRPVPTWAVQYNIKDYGAVGDNTGNQATAIQAAINAADAAGGGVVLVPKGIFRCTATVVLKQYVTLQGVHMDTSVLQFTDLGAGIYGVDCGTFGTPGQPQVHDLTIKCGTGFTMGTSPAAMYGFKATSRTYMRRVGARGFKAGVVITGDHLTFDTCHFKTNYYNVYFGPSSSTYGNHHFIACDFSNSTFASVAVAPDNIIDGTLFSGGHVGWGPYAFYKESGASSKGLLFETTLQELYFEAIGNGAILDEGSGASGQETLYGCKLINCYFAWDTPYAGAYKIAARAKDWTVQGRLMVGTEVWSDANPFSDGTVGTWNLTSVTNSVIHQPVGTLPKVVAACRGNLRWDRTGKDSGTWYTAAAAVTDKDLVEVEDLTVRTFNSLGREFAGVACATGATNDIIPVTMEGLADVVLSATSGVAHGGMPVVPDVATPTKVTVPGAGAGGYDDPNAGYIPSKFPIIGLARTAASASAAISVDLGVRSERMYVRPGAVTALPTASATYRGQFLRVEGGSGVADGLYACEKLASGAYSWNLRGPSLAVANDSIRYVTANGNDTNDALSWGTAKRTIQSAIDSFTGGGVVYVGRGSFTETVTLSSRSGVAIIGSGAEVGSGTTIKPPNDAADGLVVTSSSDCVFENFCISAQTTTWNAVLLNLSLSHNSNFKMVILRNPNNAGTVSTGGTGLKMENTEGNVFTRCYAQECSVAIDLVNEATENVFIGFKGASNYRELLVEGNCGGNTFLFTKWNNPKSSSAYQIDIGGNGSNVFVVPDWSETGAGTTKSRITSDNNVLIGGVSSPQNTMDVTGNNNLLDHFRVLKTLNVSGIGNTLRRPRLAGTSIVNTGTSTVIDRPIVESGSITYGGAVAPADRAIGAALVTTATSGFLYIPTCAGTPTGVPAAQTGLVPLVFDTTNAKLYVYAGGAWKGGTVPGAFS